LRFSAKNAKKAFLGTVNHLRFLPSKKRLSLGDRSLLGDGQKKSGLCELPFSFFDKKCPNEA
jgi:hypothetical protein